MTAGLFCWKKELPLKPPSTELKNYLLTTISFDQEEWEILAGSEPVATNPATTVGTVRLTEAGSWQPFHPGLQLEHPVVGVEVKYTDGNYEDAYELAYTIQQSCLDIAGYTTLGAYYEGCIAEEGISGDTETLTISFEVRLLRRLA
jgi:hypothetical protein